MNSKFNHNFPNTLISNYLDKLIDKIYMLLPLYENIDSSYARKDFDSYLKSLITTTLSNMSYIDYGSVLTLHIIDNLNALLTVDDHYLFRKMVFTTCNLVSQLRDEVTEHEL